MLKINQLIFLIFICQLFHLLIKIMLSKYSNKIKVITNKKKNNFYDLKIKINNCNQF